MTHSSGSSIRRPIPTFILHLRVIMFVSGFCLPGMIHAQDHTPRHASVVSSELLSQVDQLLATDNEQLNADSDLGMGPLVQIAQQGRASDTVVMSQATPHDNLKVTAIPLPDAFAMSLLLLGILLIAVTIRRIRTSM